MSLSGIKGIVFERKKKRNFRSDIPIKFLAKSTDKITHGLL